MHPTVSRVVGVLTAAGWCGEVRVLPDSARAAAEAAAGLGGDVDVDLARHAVVWAAAGHPHAVFPITYAELLRLTGGTPAEVAG